MPLYILRVSLDHLTFRLPSLLSISQTFDFPIRFVSEDKFRGILVVELAHKKDVQHLIDRGTLIMWIAELYAQAETYDDLHAQLRERPDLFDEYRQRTFKITPEAANYHFIGSRPLEIVKSFAYLDMRGGVELENPEVDFVVFEDYDSETIHTHEQRLARDGRFRTVYFGRRIGFSRARPLVKEQSVKTRAYYGNTSMEAEMGFLMANQTLARTGKIIYDPFAGTGSMLYACATFGAYVMGSDIDGRQMRGKSKGPDVTPGMLRAAAQYGVADKFLDLLTFDVTRSPIRRGGWVDAIITDPPYGVRAGAKRIGKKSTRKTPLREDPYVLEDGTFAHTKSTYVPPFRPYELVNLTLDLVLLARYLLVPRGRLVFFLPTVTEEYDAIDIPVVEGMRELKVGDGSVQDFGKWGRRLITMEKTAEDDGEMPKFEDQDINSLADKLPAHHDFARRYYERFAPRNNSTPDVPTDGESAGSS
ncbi:S-adenosyl-L-methionine-dependent methyltransferase [Naematelia encephala]|uniref:tRNA (guanine(10)-N(2))-methyltransferase n=1 Tax=Naematelia encephala TaxID=71784 RepID=A0A1Y2ASA4_9TREE|nr:S-adenosyl-L-methionine-dependent methyltransferase [Naematelia encephala]